MKYAVLASLSILFASTALKAQTTQPVAGKDTPRYRTASRSIRGRKIVVEEMFNYVCPACFAFEPRFEAWTKKLPPYVAVVPYPGVVPPRLCNTRTRTTRRRP